MLEKIEPASVFICNSVLEEVCDKAAPCLTLRSTNTTRPAVVLEPEVSVQDSSDICISSRRDLNKNLVWERGTDPELPKTQLQDSSLLLTPILAQQLQEYNFIQFLSGSPFQRLAGIDRPAWTDFMKSHHLHLSSIPRYIVMSCLIAY